MPSYTVTIPETAAPLHQGKRNVVVFAEDVAAARLAAASAFDTKTGRPAYWASLFTAATVTENVASADLEGAIMRVTVSAPTPIDLSYVAVGGDTVDDMAAAMVILLNADAQIAGAAYSAGNLLTVAETTDTLGDATVTCTMTLNGSTLGGFVGAITHEGAAGNALTVQLALDAVALPQVIGSF